MLSTFSTFKSCSNPCQVRTQLAKQIVFQHPAFESHHVLVVGPVLPEQSEDVPFDVTRTFFLFVLNPCRVGAMPNHACDVWGTGWVNGHGRADPTLPGHDRTGTNPLQWDVGRDTNLVRVVPIVSLSFIADCAASDACLGSYLPPCLFLVVVERTLSRVNADLGIQLSYLLGQPIHWTLTCVPRHYMILSTRNKVSSVTVMGCTSSS